MTASERVVVEAQEYVCADTGKLLHSVPMRRFYRLDHKGVWVKLREYPLANESIVNPGFKP